MPVILWAGIILLSSAVPASWFPQAPYWWLPKVVHVIFFFLLCLFIYRAVRAQRLVPGLRRYAIPVSLVCTVLYAVSDETHQLFVDGRHGQLSDVALDASSAFLFILVHRVRTVIRSEKPSV